MGSASSVPTDGASAHPEAASSLLKAQGNGAFKAGLFGEAVLCYSSALAAVADELAAAAATTAAAGSEPRSLRATILSNRSAALLAAGQPELALADAEAAIAARPSWPKAYFRAAAALRAHAPSRRARALELLRKAEAIATSVLGGGSASDVASIRQQAAEIEAEAEAAAGADAGSGAGAGAAPGAAAVAAMLGARGQSHLLTWGSGTHGCLGHGDARDKPHPRAVGALRGKHIVDIGCGVMHTVACTADGEVWAWGANAQLQCGWDGHCDAAKQGRAAEQLLEPLPVPSLLALGVHAVAVACGAGHTLILDDRGWLFSWGIGRQGQLGHAGASLPQQSEPARVDFGGEGAVVGVAAGLAHSACVRSDGAVFTWGWNRDGQLGTGGEADVPRPRRCCFPGEAELAAAAAAAAAEQQQQQRAADGDGALGAPAQLPQVACGGGHSAVVLHGALYTTGSGGCGQLGHGTYDDERSWRRVGGGFAKLPGAGAAGAAAAGAAAGAAAAAAAGAAAAAAATVSFVACGEEFTCAVTATRSVWAFGLNNVCQLGQGEDVASDGGGGGANSSNNNFATPQIVRALEGQRVELLSCNMSQAVAITAAGQLFSWGVAGADLERVAFDPAGTICSAPRPVGAVRRKRVLRLECGRRHFALVTVPTFAPCSEVRWGRGGGGGRAEPPTLLEAGAPCVATILARDLHGARVEVGSGDVLPLATYFD